MPKASDILHAEMCLVRCCSGHKAHRTIFLHSLVGVLCSCRRWIESRGTLILRQGLVFSKVRLKLYPVNMRTCRRYSLSIEAVRLPQAGSGPPPMEDMTVYRCLASMGCCPLKPHEPSWTHQGGSAWWSTRCVAVERMRSGLAGSSSALSWYLSATSLGG